MAFNITKHLSGTWVEYEMRTTKAAGWAGYITTQGLPCSRGVHTGQHVPWIFLDNNNKKILLS